MAVVFYAEMFNSIVRDNCVSGISSIELVSLDYHCGDVM